MSSSKKPQQQQKNSRTTNSMDPGSRTNSSEKFLRQPTILLAETPISGISEKFQAQEQAERDNERKVRKERMAAKKRRKEEVASVDASTDPSDKLPGESPRDEHQSSSSSASAASTAIGGRIGKDERQRPEYWHFKSTVPHQKDPPEKQVREHLVYVIRECPELQVQRELTWAALQVAESAVHKLTRRALITSRLAPQAIEAVIGPGHPHGTLAVSNPEMWEDLPISEEVLRKHKETIQIQIKEKLKIIEQEERTSRMVKTYLEDDIEELRRRVVELRREEQQMEIFVEASKEEIEQLRAVKRALQEEDGGNSDPESDEEEAPRIEETGSKKGDEAHRKIEGSPKKASSRTEAAQKETGSPDARKRDGIPDAARTNTTLTPAMVDPKATSTVTLTSTTLAGTTPLVHFIDQSGIQKLTELTYDNVIKFRTMLENEKANRRELTSAMAVGLIEKVTQGLIESQLRYARDIDGNPRFLAEEVKQLKEWDPEVLCQKLLQTMKGAHREVNETIPATLIKTRIPTTYDSVTRVQEFQKQLHQLGLKYGDDYKFTVVMTAESQKEVIREWLKKIKNCKSPGSTAFHETLSKHNPKNIEEFLDKFYQMATHTEFMRKEVARYGGGEVSSRGHYYRDSGSYRDRHVDRSYDRSRDRSRERERSRDRKDGGDYIPEKRTRYEEHTESGGVETVAAFGGGNKRPTSHYSPASCHGCGKIGHE